MEVHTVARNQAAYPAQALYMHKPPSHLYYRGDLSATLNSRRVAIVGSRRMSSYGQQVTVTFARELAQQGITIVSGLALGVDAAAHHAALNAGGRCLAVLPCSVDDVVPRSNYRLAEAILAQGGALISQYPPGSQNHKGNFVARNELVAALSEVLLITEAAEGSGSLHTAKFAHDMPTEVRAVPGNITSPTSVGTNSLLRAGEAGAALCTTDILNTLGISNKTITRPRGATQAEQTVLDLLSENIYEGEALLTTSQLPIAEFNQTLTMLEITGKIIPLGANRWSLP